MPDAAPASSVPADAREALLAWYAANGRGLAFRRTTDPYAILVSEVIAQQTQAARAADRWERFMIRFPTVEDLAAATPAEVLREWQGLGYDRRGLRLRQAARRVVNEHDGRIPSSIEALVALPGIGPYTARAVAAIAFGQAVGAVDVNVRRVLGRIVAGSEIALDGKRLRDLADATVPAGRSAAWTHAIMDLGATICRARRPQCQDCPVRTWCRFAIEGGETAPRQAPAVVARPAFADTNRWLRGRILDRLRAAADHDWVPLDRPIGSHDLGRVHAAVSAMAADGLLELGRSAEGTTLARLPV